MDNQPQPLLHAVRQSHICFATASLILSAPSSQSLIDRNFKLKSTALSVEYNG
eukprot:UN14024